MANRIITIKFVASISQEQPLEVDQHQSAPASSRQCYTTTTNNNQLQSQAILLGQHLISPVSEQQLVLGQLQPGNSSIT